jgi:hypothetical protein
MADFELQRMTPAKTAVGCTVATATLETSKAVYIGASATYKFYFPSTATWITFNGCVAGTILPISVKGCTDAADGAPGAGVIVFLY